MYDSEDYRREDPLRVGRGIVLGVVLGAVIWAILLGGIYIWIRWL